MTLLGIDKSQQERQRLAKANRKRISSGPPLAAAATPRPSDELGCPIAIFVFSPFTCFILASLLRRLNGQ